MFSHLSRARQLTVRGRVGPWILACSHVLVEPRVAFPFIREMSRRERGGYKRGGTEVQSRVCENRPTTLFAPWQISDARPGRMHAHKTNAYFVSELQRSRSLDSSFFVGQRAAHTRETYHSTPANSQMLAATRFRNVSSLLSFFFYMFRSWWTGYLISTRIVKWPRIPAAVVALRASFSKVLQIVVGGID